ncbi:threonine aldolase family protein [Amphiplicatus metriothermophilus]|uniref:L-threonine aldolase n=1 Tax=Amphiplicatus metriothermophilus TaxID=1519374 RepID=A0A239PKR4_9PROT|nr:low specificity L-threonine aldolase [Amphiplicatus metriothermophilus]MBB5517743.1 threonine aldolase [Amphiplicatus metriothermophilus]SNT67923.1 L-threonine aldolase [Amphiplicatus metriothermophilus]
MIFASDNWAGAAREILDAVARANDGLAPSYGGDELSARVEARFCEIFERDVAVFLVATGGAANGLALSVTTPPYGMILCHEESHVQMDECCGPEFFTGGAKLLPIEGFAAKLSPETIAAALKGFPERPPHGAPPRVLSLTQATECGAVYKPGELRALCALAHERGLRVHMDGARFANAVAALDCAPADISWKAGVDVLCFGATKNGCIAAEAVVFFDRDAAADFAFRRKRAGHLWSKQRFIAAQFEAYLKDGLWLRLAARANAMARRLSDGLAAVDGVEIVYPTEANEVFAAMPATMAEALRRAGAVFYPWATPGDPTGGRLHRLIASFRTTEEDVDRLLALARSAA